MGRYIQFEEKRDLKDEELSWGKHHRFQYLANRKLDKLEHFFIR